MDGDAILLGGRFDKQTICGAMPMSEKQLPTMLPFNTGIMKYRRGYYPILMPCGEITVEAQDEDTLNIFA